MPEEPYTKREQDYHFQVILDRMDKQDVVLKRIEDQTIKTNGRVSRLEWWRSSIVWAGSVLGIICLTFIPIFLSQMREQRKELRLEIGSIKETLLNYDFEIVD